MPLSSLAVRAHRAASRLADILAVVGALVLLAGAAILTYSVVLRVVASGQVRGDFEIVAVSSGIAILLFLPYCQARRAHVLIEVFTAWLPESMRRAMDGLWSLVLAVAAALLSARLFVGLQDAWSRNDVTMMLQIPLFAVFVAALIGVVCTAILALLDFVIAFPHTRTGQEADR
jgi:TRAP-type C4-dicarboxylate transport system permease small subunit